MVIAKSTGPALAGEDAPPSSPSVNCPDLPTTLFTVVSVSVPNTNFFGVMNFCVVDLCSNLPFGNK